MNIISKDTFGGGDSASSELITLCNANGLVAQFTSYGARWVSMWTPDRNGKLEDVLLGFDTLEGFKAAHEKYYGAIVGRVCGRIQQAHFYLDGCEYELVSNDVYGNPVKNHLHGGLSAFHNQLWEGYFSMNDKGEEEAIFYLTSKENEEGYPGTLKTKVTYTLTHNNSLCMKIEATCDKRTIVNLTNHAFFNLNGVHCQTDVLSHQLKLYSSSIIECDEELVPTGALFDVSQTLLDFRKESSISISLRSELFKIEENNGFSLAYALDKKENDFSLAAELVEKRSGRKLALYTNQSSLQVYTGYFLNGKDIGKNNVPYYMNAGIALEPQGYPDAINHPEFPSIVLDPGCIYTNQTEYVFGVVE